MRQQEEGPGENIDSTKHLRQKIWLAIHHSHNLFRYSLATFFFILLGFGAYVFICCFLVSYLIAGNSLTVSKFTGLTFHNQTGDGQKFFRKRDEVVIPLNCSLGNSTKACPANYYPTNFTVQNHNFSRSNPPGKCPEYFRWIHEDLWPWRETGITKEMVMRTNQTSTFRLIILNGKAYVETYGKSFQSRDTFTLWGILQLLRRYPGQVPDLELMFDCGDMPTVLKSEFYKNRNVTSPPPLFRYCGDDKTFDIAFPDWSFWGWPEINIKPWEPLSRDLQDGNERTKWIDRKPNAYWKGNPQMSNKRKELFKCKAYDHQDRSALIYAQNWIQEQKRGFKHSDLSKQCKHRFKIYVDGRAWSVSEKYILACDSVTLFVKSNYYDFFTRSLMPLQHYWPIRDVDECRSIKYAVEWGNSHEQQAQVIGSAGSRFIQEELKMEYVYDYMFHLLSQYAKLLTYKPSVPPGAVELCSEAIECPEKDTLFKKFMNETLARGPNDESPCDIPPPYDPATLLSIIERKKSSMKQVETWEKQFWDSQNKQG